LILVATDDDRVAIRLPIALYVFLSLVRTKEGDRSNNPVFAELRILLHLITLVPLDDL